MTRNTEAGEGNQAERPAIMMINIGKEAVSLQIPITADQITSSHSL